MSTLLRDAVFQVNYFPSRYDKARHAKQYPIDSKVHTGKRERAVIGKENNFKQVMITSSGAP